MKIFKMLVSIVICVLVAFNLMPITFAASVNEGTVFENILGDANEDGKVNVKDATAIQKYVASIINFNESQLMMSDANEDSKVNVKDATAIQKYIAGIQLENSIGAQILQGDSIESNSDYHSFMEGFTDIKVTDDKSALKAVDSVSGVLGIKEADQELKIDSVNTVENNTFYRMQHYYEGIPVYNSNVILASDENGNALALTANIGDVTDLSTTPNLNELDVSKVVNSEFDGDYTISSSCLVIYNNHEVSTNYSLAYKVNVFANNKSYEIFVSAIDGSILDSFENNFYGRVNSSGQDNKNNTRNFYCEQVKDNLFYLADFDKNISVYNAGNKDVYLTPNENYDGFEVHWQNVWYSMDSWFTKAEVVQNSKNEWKNKDAVTLMANLSDVYDYYKANFEMNGFDNNNGEVFAIINDNIEGDTTNAYSSSVVGINETVISMGIDNSINLDTVAHEYTHSVIGYRINLRNGEAGAINEAYADIMGELIENDSTWTHGRRTIASPLDNSYPDFYRGENWIDTTDTSESNDRGGVHKNSTVISHAAYLMWNGIDGSDNRKIDSITLSKLWYNSILLLQSNSTFSQCRNAVELAARIMLKNDQLTEEQYKTVIRAFDEVGIDNAVFSATETVTNDFELSVLSSKGTENVHFKLEVIKMPIIKAGPGVVNELPKLVQEIAAVTGHQSLSLKDGTYVLRVSEINDNSNISKAINIKINVDGDNDESVNNVIINTDFTDVIVVALDGGNTGEDLSSIRLSEYYYSNEGFMDIYKPNLLLNPDGTFVFVENLAEAMGTYKGTYQISEDQLLLKVEFVDFYGFKGEDVDFISFTIADKNKLTLNTDLCLSRVGNVFSVKEDSDDEFLTDISSASPTAIEISSAAELHDKIESNPSGDFILTCDIDLGSYNNGQWIPLCEDTFTGVLDGQGHKITNLNVSNVDYAGLFCRIDNGTIKNLGIEANQISGYDYAGGIAAFGGGTVYNCYVSCPRITSGGYAGGVFASDYNNPNLEYVKVKSNICADIYASYDLGSWSSYGAAGGIIGWLLGGEMTAKNIVIEGNVESQQYGESEYGDVSSGGVIGKASDTKLIQIISANILGDVSSTTRYGIKETFASGTVWYSGPSAYSGGVIGQEEHYYGTGHFTYDNTILLSGCVVSGDVTTTSKNSAYAGGFIATTFGLNENGYVITIDQCEYKGNVKSVTDEEVGSITYAGGAFGSCDSSTYIKNTVVETSVLAQNGAYSANVGKITASGNDVIDVDSLDYSLTSVTASNDVGKIIIEENEV